MICSGADLRAGKYSIKGNKMTWSYQMDKDVHKTGDWCDDFDFIREKDPRTVLNFTMGKNDLSY